MLKTLKYYLNEGFQIGFAIVLAGIGLKTFLLPNHFLDGGVTGIALLVNAHYPIKLSILLVLLSVPFLAMAYWAISKRVFAKSLIGIVGLAAFIQFGSFTALTEDKLLIAIFGGLLLGLGIGIAIRNGAVLDGSEILGVYLNERFGLPIGQVIFGFNLIIFSIAALSLSLETAMYSVLTYLVTAKVTDTVIRGFEDFIGIMIVSKHADQVKTVLREEAGLGLTIYKGDKPYGEHEEVLIIHTIINRIDIKKVHHTLDAVDPKAFVVEYEVNSIRGGVLRRYLNKKGPVH
jgi:uncharacterized membrane-anchored protein YitT (DUF2179 family)